MGAPGTTEGPWAIHSIQAVIVPIAHLERPIGGAEDSAYDLATYAQEICAMHWPDRNRLESEVRANAQQMAASGALYDALAEVLGWIANWSPDFTEDDEWPASNAKARAALALARGEPTPDRRGMAGGE